MPNSFSVPSDHRWLDEAACADLGIEDYFVEAGHVIEDQVLETCRGCPVRRECVTHAYTRDVTGGYFGGMSPGQRRDMDLPEALRFIRIDEINNPRGVVGTDSIDEDDFGYH